MVRIRRKLILWSAFLAIFRFAAVSAWALDSSLPPGSNFDLSHWYLQLPVDSSGGTTGVSASVSTAQLTNGYTSALYFYTGSDGAMVFWAPVTGAHTSGSDYPRCELREELSPGDTSVNWIGYGTHILDVQCKVLQVPSTGKVIIGQVKGYSGAALPLVKIQYESGTVYGYIKTNANNDASDKKYAYANVGLSNSIAYQVKVVNGLISVTVNSATNSLNVFTTDPNWATNTVYFKAGDYCQDNGGTTNEGARVSFDSLTASHAPAITSQPTNQIVTAGQNATFMVGANGNGTLGYQWQFNATNALARATNVSLTITNAQSTNAGNYSVVVTDSIGSVTSAVATLAVNVGTSSTLARSNYQSVITNQSPSYYFKLDGNLVDAIGGTATFTANGGATFGGDYFGNANDAALFPATSDYLSLTTPVVISGEGTSTAVGSLSLLFYVPGSIPTTGYYFSDSDTTGAASGNQPANSALALQFSSSALTLKLVNTSVTLPAVTANTWYYLALTYNLNGTVTSVNGVNYYLGAAGGTLSSGFKQKGGSGNINSTGTLGDGNTLIVGNKQAAVVPVSGGTSTAGVASGEIDELATWSTQLNASQIASQFSALTVAAGTPPTLGITVSGTNAIISWPSGTDPGFVLQSATNLASPTWSSAGTPAAIGNQNIVTNALNWNAQFYRLKK